MSLNLCCISLALKEKGYGFQIITWTRFQKLGRTEGLRILSDRILNNVRVTQKTIEYCVQNNWGYRLSSTIFPLISFDKANIKVQELKDHNEIMDILAETGQTALKENLRLSSHPNEFTTLDSENRAAILRSITDLELHGFLHNSLGLPKNYSNPINIHLKNEHLGFVDHKNRINESISLLSDNVKSRLVFENNDKGRWHCDNLASHYSNIPLTYDNLHDLVNPSGEQNTNIRRFCATWGNYKPLFHYSEGREDKKRAHRDYPQNNLNFFQNNRKDLADYDVELKMKDRALNMMEGK